MFFRMLRRFFSLILCIFLLTCISLAKDYFIDGMFIELIIILLFAVAFGFFIIKVWPSKKEITNTKTESQSDVQMQNLKLAKSDLPDVAIKEDILVNNKSDLEEVLNYSSQNSPIDITDLLWKLDGKEKNTNASDEPSALSKKVPVAKGVAEPLGYYPSYQKMSPQQRYKYLTWLENGISESIDIGYVFTFYYGLERHILEGNLERSVEVINYLKHYHHNKSFGYYSNNALMLAAFLSKNVSYLSYLDYDNLNDEMYANVKYSLNKKLTAEDITRVHKAVNFTNDRYIKSENVLFTGNVNRVLAKKYNTDAYYISTKIPLKRKNNLKSTALLANYSLNDTERILPIPNVLGDKKISNDLYEILFEAHELTKNELKIKRKSVVSSISLLK